MPTPATAAEIERMIMIILAGIRDAEKITGCRIISRAPYGFWDMEPVVDGPPMLAPLDALQRIVANLQAEFYLIK